MKCCAPQEKIWDFRSSEIDLDAIGVLKSLHFFYKYVGGGGPQNPSTLNELWLLAVVSYQPRSGVQSSIPYCC